MACNDEFSRVFNRRFRLEVFLHKVRDLNGLNMVTKIPRRIQESRRVGGKASAKETKKKALTPEEPVSETDKDFTIIPEAPQIN
jgi:hypothetical protein